MKTPARIVLFGLLSGLLWSVVPGTLANLFDSRANAPATLIAGAVAGLVTTAALASVLGRLGRVLAVMLGLLSLPTGAFIFGFAFELVAHSFPTLSSGDRQYLPPWMLGLNFAVLSVVSIFAVGLFPLAVLTTLLLRRMVVGAKKPENTATSSVWIHMKDLTDPRWIKFKGLLFLVGGVLAAALLFLEAPTLRVAVLLAIVIWCFCRAYYFAFYVLEKYVDPGFRFSGLFSAVKYLCRRHHH